MSIRIDKQDYEFVKKLAREDKQDLSNAVRDLISRGRTQLAIEEYAKGRASLGRASLLTGVSISEMMDILASYGIKSNLEQEDYRAGLENLKDVY